MTKSANGESLRLSSKAVIVLYQSPYWNGKGTKKWMRSNRVFFPEKGKSAVKMAHEFIHSKRTFDDYKDFELHFLAGGKKISTSITVQKRDI